MDLKRILMILMLFAVIGHVSGFDTGKKPMKAAALSLFIPGGGQLYNGSYWKFGIFAATETALIGYAVYNFYEGEDYYDLFLETGSEEYYNRYQDYYYDRQNTYWWLGITIFLSTIDAYVDANLYNFEQTKKKVRLKFEENALLISYDF